MLELLVVLPFLIAIVIVLGSLATVVQTSHSTSDQLKVSLWYADTSASRLAHTITQPVPTEVSLMPQTVTRDGRLLRDDGFLSPGESFQTAVLEDSMILKGIGLQISQASAELIRGLGSPFPLREVRSSTIPSVGIVGHRDMPLPRRISRHE